MKKLLLIIFLIAATPSFSQTTNWVSYRNSYAEWSEYSEKWVWSEIKFANIPVIISKSGIKLENKNQSSFRTYDDLGEKVTYTDNVPRVKITTHSWLAYDKDGKRCKLSMAFFDSDEYDPMTINVQYDEIVFRFYCKKRTSLDSFKND